MAKESEAVKAKIKKVMEEFHAGNLKSSSGQPVRTFAQALSIAFSQAHQMGLTKKD